MTISADEHTLSIIGPYRDIEALCAMATLGMAFMTEYNDKPDLLDPVLKGSPPLRSVAGGAAAILLGDKERARVSRVHAILTQVAVMSERRG